MKTHSSLFKFALTITFVFQSLISLPSAFAGEGGTSGGGGISRSHEGGTSGGGGISRTPKNGRGAVRSNDQQSDEADSAPAMGYAPLAQDVPPPDQDADTDDQQDENDPSFKKSKNQISRENFEAILGERELRKLVPAQSEFASIKAVGSWADQYSYIVEYRGPAGRCQIRVNVRNSTARVALVTKIYARSCGN